MSHRRDQFAVGTQEHHFAAVYAVSEGLHPESKLLPSKQGWLPAERFKVTEVPLHRIGTGREHIDAQREWEPHDEEYARSMVPHVDRLPPIILGHKSAAGRYDFYDGSHRLVAHHLAGRKTIRAFVPMESS